MNQLKESFRLSGICNGTLYRRAATPRSNWHLRIWINGEGRDFRICLKTTDIEEARKRATKEAFRINNLIEGGQQVLGATLKRLVAEFSDEQQLQQSLGHLRESTRTKNGYFITRGLRFLAENGITLENRLNTLNGGIFKKYLDWRRAELLKRGGSITAIETKGGAIDHNKALTGDDLTEFG